MTRDTPLAPMSPTSRTNLGRLSERKVADRAELHDFLKDALVAHLGVVVGTHPVVLPTAYAIDLSGPDRDGTIYVHGSVAAGWLRAATDTTVCVTVTELDGLVVGRSPFHHSMNYRSAVVIGSARLVDDPQERTRALDLIVDHMVPGRAATLRPSTRKELLATAVLAVSLHEASMKTRAGGPDDEPTDISAGIWGGHVPVSRVIHPPVPDGDATGPIPEDVVRRTPSA